RATYLSFEQGKAARRLPSLRGQSIDQGPMKFRDYQEYAIASIFRYFEQGGKGNPIVAMPTGTGKSVVIGGFIREVMLRYPGQRIIVLTHVKELIEQNYKKLLALWPTAPAGVYSAGLRRREIGLPITFAGI